MVTVKGLCPHLLSAYDRQPEDMILLDALIDYALEEGEEVVAEGLKNLRQCEHSPTLWADHMWLWDRSVKCITDDVWFRMPFDGDRSCASGQLTRYLEGYLQWKAAVQHQDNV